MLRTAKPVEHQLTIPEGLTAVQIAALVHHAEAAAGTVVPPPEGSVLPQTYSYEYGTPRGDLAGARRSRDGPGVGRGLGGACARACRWGNRRTR